MVQVLDILEYPDPRLTTVCEPVELAQLPEFQGFIDDLIYTMYFSGGVGLAAPQVGNLVRIFTIDQRPVNGNAQADPWVFVNPRVEALGGKLERRKEGCLSFPGIFIWAKRSRWVRVTAHDRHGEEFTMDCKGSDLLSLAVQHENDHLDGVLMSDHADKRGRRDLKRWGLGRGPQGA
jgi:peptide deformylase